MARTTREQAPPPVPGSASTTDDETAAIAVPSGSSSGSRGRLRIVARVALGLAIVAVLGLAIGDLLLGGRVFGAAPTASTRAELYGLDSCTLITEADRTALGLVGAGTPTFSVPGRGCLWRSSGGGSVSLTLEDSETLRVQQSGNYARTRALRPDLVVNEYTRTVGRLPVDYLAVNRVCSAFVTIEGARSAIDVVANTQDQDSSCDLATRFVSRLDPRLP